MKKKIVIILGTFIVLVFVGFSVFHNKWTDRINPTIPETISYAKVAKGQNRYHQVKIIDSKTGKVLPYKLEDVGGYLPDRQYISIDHKGQYVRNIKYISKQEYLRVANK